MEFIMEQEIKNILGNIKNPLTGKSLSEENRLVAVDVNNDTLKVKYNREGIAPQEKKQIENEIYSLVSDKFVEDNITVMSVSEESKDVFEAHGVLADGETAEEAQNKTMHETKKAAPANEAQLKPGHGPNINSEVTIPGVKKIIAVASGKGGVGKSTVSVNLAISLKNQGKKVAILDADVYGPSIPMLLGKAEAKPIANDDNKILPIESCGIGFMSFGLFIGESEPVIWRGPMLGGVLNQFFFDVDWGELDYLIVDLPPGTGDVQLSLIQSLKVDGAIVVSTPQDVALLDAKKGVEMFRQLETPILGMVENMSYFVTEDSDKRHYIFGQGGVKLACRKMDLEFLGEVPLEIALREGSDNGKPYMNDSSFEGRPVWNSYMEISKSVLELTKDKKEAGFFSKLLS
jgi:ATP-binding protein involved in chromosome partitioning